MSDKIFKFIHNKYDIESDGQKAIAHTTMTGDELALDLYNNDTYLESDSDYVVAVKDDFTGKIVLYKIAKE